MCNINDKKYILMVNCGGLGNQIFQYLAVKKIFSNCVILSLNSRSILNVFEIDDLKWMKCAKIIEKISRRVIVPYLVVPVFKLIKIGTYVYEEKEKSEQGVDGQSGRIKVQPGRLNVVLVDNIYSQNMTKDGILARKFSILKIKNKIKEMAVEEIKRISGAYSEYGIVVHVRRGDYINFSSYGVSGIALKTDYYLNAINYLRSVTAQDNVVYVVTDDVLWCKNNLSILGNIYFLSVSEKVDFAILSLFKYVVISNSTFSLSASCVSELAQVIVAPKFWFGHEVGRWYPPRIQSDDNRFIYI